jgi:hypothetical protein
MRFATPIFRQDATRHYVPTEPHTAAPYRASGLVVGGSRRMSAKPGARHLFGGDIGAFEAELSEKLLKLNQIRLVFLESPIGDQETPRL